MNRRGWLIGLGGAAILLLGLGWALMRRPEAGSPPAIPSSSAPPAPAAPPSPTAHDPKVLFARAEAARARGDLAEARTLYEEVLQLNPDPQTAESAQQRLGEVNVQGVLSTARSPGQELYTVQPGDTLSKIARAKKTTVELLRSANGIQGDLIRVGQALKIPAVSFSVIVDKSQNVLSLKNGEEIFKTYRCSTGEGGITPAGEFRIASRLKDPAWKGIVPPGDPGNPLGSRWLGFDLPEYGIHGTNNPETIGKPVTKGCIRLTNADVEELYVLLPEGTPVTVVD